MNQNHLGLNALLVAKSVLLQDIQNLIASAGDGQATVLLHLQHFIFPSRTNHGLGTQTGGMLSGWRPLL